MTGENGVKLYVVKPVLNKNQLEKKANTRLKRSDIPQIIDHDADVYIEYDIEDNIMVGGDGEMAGHKDFISLKNSTYGSNSLRGLPKEDESSDEDSILRRSRPTDEKGRKLLLRFRKGVLSKNKRVDFYENIQAIANEVSSNRGNVTGDKNKKSKHFSEYTKVKSNIIGYFDEHPPHYKAMFRENRFGKPVGARPCKFNLRWPEKYKKCIPLIQEIDAYYKRYLPNNYQNQYEKASKVGGFRIPGTSFTTVTTNVNFQTTVHKDKGDDLEGFGNLAVLERGEYEGGETCFPEFGVGVDVREGDVLFMDVHQYHANLPIVGKGDDYKRLSIVCYLRTNLWKNLKDKTVKQKKDWDKKLRTFFRKTIKEYSKEKGKGKGKDKKE